MSTLLFVVLLLFLPNIYASFCPISLFDHALIDDDDFKVSLVGTEPLLISMGSNCSAAYHIQRHGWRVASFPFDWNFSTMQGICQILEEDFEHFLDDKYLISAPPPYYFSVYNTRYDFYFSHDFPVPGGGLGWPDYLNSTAPPVREKYARRIERFKSLNNYENKVYFLRLIFNYFEPDISDIVMLKQTLLKQFPTLDFELIVIFYGFNKTFDLSPYNIRNFYIHAQEPRWDLWLKNGIEEQFCAVFESLGIPKRAATNHTVSQLIDEGKSS